MADSRDPTDAEVDALLEKVLGGARVAVPDHLELYPDTKPEHSLLRLGESGRLEHVTCFREFAPGHGWSVEQVEVRAVEVDDARRLLRRSLRP